MPSSSGFHKHFALMNFHFKSIFSSSAALYPSNLIFCWQRFTLCARRWERIGESVCWADCWVAAKDRKLVPYDVKPSHIQPKSTVTTIPCSFPLQYLKHLFNPFVKSLAHRHGQKVFFGENLTQLQIHFRCPHIIMPSGFLMRWAYLGLKFVSQWQSQSVEEIEAIKPIKRIKDQGGAQVSSPRKSTRTTIIHQD